MMSVEQLCDHLGIRHPLEQSTCIGYGQRKPTCGCAVAIASRQSAISILKDVTCSITTGQHIRSSDLLGAASLLLCKRFHQSQADENVARWKQCLQSWSPPSASRASRSSSTQQASTQSTTTSHSARILSDKALLRELKRRLDNNPSTRLINGVLELAGPLQDSDDESSDESDNSASEDDYNDSTVNNDYTVEEPSDVDDDTHIAVPRIARQLVAQASNNIHNGDRRIISTRPGRFSPSGTSITTSSQQLDSRRQDTTTVSARPTPSSNVASRTIDTGRNSRVSALQAPSRSQSPLRHSHIECSVCLMPYEIEHNIGCWECEHCQNRVHQLCFDQWAASLPPSRRLRCIYCRAGA